MIQVAALLDLFIGLSHDVGEATHVGDLESLAQERVTDLLDTVLVASGAAKNDQVGDFLDFILHEWVKVSQCLASSDSEEHPLHSLHFFHFDGTSDEFERVVHEWLGVGVRFLVARSLSGSSTTETFCHLLDKFDDFVVVLKLVDVALDFINGFALSAHKAFAVTNLRLDGIEEQVVALLLLVLDGL